MVSILLDVDFALVLIIRDGINFAYILILLEILKAANQEESEKRRWETDELLI